MLDLIYFDIWRRDFGQRKYGLGTENAGWRRDNGRDVVEELHDAIVISEFWYSRLGAACRRNPLLIPVFLAVYLMTFVIRIQMDIVNILRSLTPRALRTETGVKRYPPTNDTLMGWEKPYEEKSSRAS